MPTPPSDNSSPAPNRTNGAGRVVTIGTFDGVHRGHQALLERARERAGSGGVVAALVFDPNPIEVLRPAQAPARLASFDQKSELLRRFGADEVHRLEPTPELLNESPEQFIREVLGRHRVTGVVEGPDFRFGRGRAGDVASLAAMGERLGFTVDVVQPVTVTLNDHTIAPARSTIVRWLLGHGRADDAARVLGHPYTMRGRVVRGDRRGRTIGFPTANLDSPCLAPADGVYAGVGRLPDGRVLPAAISVGTKPSFGDRPRTVEAVLLNPALDPAELGGLPEYGWTLDLEFHRWVRDQARFGSLDGLVGQIRRDCSTVVSLVAGVSAVTTVPPTPEACA